MARNFPENTIILKILLNPCSVPPLKLLSGDPVVRHRQDHPSFRSLLLSRARSDSVKTQSRYGQRKPCKMRSI
jgi:hypothetical protein